MKQASPLPTVTKLSINVSPKIADVEFYKAACCCRNFAAEHNTVLFSATLNLSLITYV